MQEGFAGTPHDRPIEPTGPAAAVTDEVAREPDPFLDDPRLITVLSTEHWSLLTARSLAYNEAFIRAGMFFTLLSTSLIAISFLAGAIRDATTALVVIAFVLGVDFLVGVLTAIRIIGCNTEDANAMRGMNRIRNGYVQVLPKVRPFFVTDIHDDGTGVARSYGFRNDEGVVRTLLYGLSTSAGLVVIVDAIVGGATAAVAAAVLGGSLSTAIVTGLVASAATLVLLVALTAWLTYSAFDAIEARYPTPPADARPS
jgi:hypothetical protein